ncbi:MAG: hypothetical protein RLZZ401_1985, partial [Pseudomonadota bacterium]
MAFKLLHTVVAVTGIAAASGAAWWYQNKPAAATQTASAADVAPAPAGGASGAAGGGGPGRAPTVEVAKVEIMKLTDDTQAVGNLRSRQSVVLRPEVSGRITQLNFKDGDRVRKGQLLVQFDDQLQLAQVKQSEAELSIARANHKRNQDLAAQNFISARTVDESAAGLDVALAKLALSQATAARLKIIAPFDGMTGIRTVNAGDYLKDGSDIVNVEDLDAVFVDFRLPERFLTKVKKGQKATVDLDALPGRKFVAVVQAVDPLIDANGRSVGIRGCIDNRQMQLRPGMFARVTAVFGERERARVIPEEAIVPQGQRQYVLKVVDGPDKDSKVTQRVEVKVGIRRPGRVEILEGLGDDDVVVVAGQQRVQRDGSPVRVMDVVRGPRPVGGPQPGASAPQAAASAPAAAPARPAPGKAGAAAPTAQGLNPCLASESDVVRSDDPRRGGSGAGRPAAKI